MPSGHLLQGSLRRRPRCSRLGSPCYGVAASAHSALFLVTMHSQSLTTRLLVESTHWSRHLRQCSNNAKALVDSPDLADLIQQSCSLAAWEEQSIVDGRYDSALLIWRPT